MNAIKIYENINRKTYFSILGFWIVVFFIFWVFSPIKTIPSPYAVYEAFMAMSRIEGSGNLVYNVWITLELQFFGILYSVIISLLFTYLSVLPFFKPLNKFVQLLRYIPVVGFTLIFYSFFPIGFGLKVAMLTAGLTFFLTTAMTGVIESISAVNYELAKSLNYKQHQIFWSVVLKPTLPLMIGMVRQNAAMGWLMIMAVETFNRTEGGIGARLQIYSASSQMAEVYTYLIIIAMLALLEDALFRGLETYPFPYARIKERA